MIDIIIPTYRLSTRGWDRVYNSLVSLNFQTMKPNNVFVINSSDYGEFRVADKKMPKYSFVHHIHLPLKEFNKPKMLNFGVNIAESEYVMCTDADYLFSHKFVENLYYKRSESRLILKEVLLLSNNPITIDKIKKWDFNPRSAYVHMNKRGENLANGACQFTLTEWFKSNPYNEQMSGCGGMDNLCVYTAKHQGLGIYWMQEAQVLHQWHRSDKFDTPRKISDFKRNQEIIEKEYKLMYGKG